jgi:hypothetical protein
MRCATCRHELKEGINVFQVEEGVLGMAGFVPLEEPNIFCSVECLKDFFSASRGYEQAPRRVP